MQQSKNGARKERGHQWAFDCVEEAIHQIRIKRDLLQQAKREVAEEAMCIQQVRGQPVQCPQIETHGA